MFAWAHNGVCQNGGIEVRDDGILVTQWNTGKWRALPDNGDRIEMVFRSCLHNVHFTDDGFIADQKYRIKDGLDMRWPRDRKSRGWIIRKGIHPRLWRSDFELNALLSRRDLTPAEAREAD